MTQWNLDGRQVAYDGTSAEEAHAVGQLTTCPTCATGHDARSATVVEPADVDGTTLRSLGLERLEPIPNVVILRTVSGLASNVFQVECTCGTPYLAACSIGEWQPTRWIALESMAVPAAIPQAGRDWGQALAVTILALVIAGVVGVHVFAAHSFLRGRATVQEGQLATVQVLRIDHNTGPRTPETWHAVVSDGTFERRVRVSESHASRASVERTLEVLTRSEPPLRGHVEVAGEQRYDDGPYALLAVDAIAGLMIAAAWFRRHRRLRRP